MSRAHISIGKQVNQACQNPVAMLKRAIGLCKIVEGG